MTELYALRYHRRLRNELLRVADFGILQLKAIVCVVDVTLTMSLYNLIGQYYVALHAKT